MNENLSWLSSSNEIDVKGELRNPIVDSGFKNYKGTDERYPSASFLLCGSASNVNNTKTDNPDCARSYNDDIFQLFGKAWSLFHLFQFISNKVNQLTFLSKLFCIYTVANGGSFSYQLTSCLIK